MIKQSDLQKNIKNVDKIYLIIFLNVILKKKSLR